MPFGFKNYEPFAPKPENGEKREPFGTNVQKCAPFRIVGKAVPKCANPLQTFSKSPSPLKVLSRICTECKPFRFIRERVAKSENPLQIYAKTVNPQIIHFGFFKWFELLVKFWQACARKCEPFASLRQKCEPFASLRQKCEPFASLR